MEKFCELIKGEKPVFVEFYASWCPHCRRMMPIIDDLKKEMREKMAVLQYDIDEEENARLVNYYHVQAVPLMMVYKSGEQLWRQNGEMDKEQLEQTLRRIL